MQDKGPEFINHDTGSIRSMVCLNSGQQYCPPD